MMRLGIDAREVQQGVSTGIGRALADVFHKAGHEVWACARKPHDVARLATAR